MANSNSGGFLDRTFKLKENKTDVRTEIVAGVTTFMTMAYILAVNPNILSASGMDRGAIFTATALASCVATLMMALFANYPFVLAPGMGLNAYFAYTVVLGMGYSWQIALTAVFVEGLIFIVLSVTNVREAIFNAIPLTLKHAVSAGIGFFIAFIGLQNAKIVIDSSTLVSLYNFKGSIANGTFNSEGITVLLALIGIVITGILMVRQVKGGILWGILITWGLGMICELTGLYVPNAELGMYSVIPNFSAGFSVPSLAPTFMKLDFTNVLSLNFFVVVFAFLFVDIFDTLGTLIGVASKADMLDKNGKLPKISGALLADAIGTSFGLARHLHHNNIRRERFRRRRRRPHRPHRCHGGDPLRPVPVPLSDLPCDSVVRHGAGACHGRLPDDLRFPEDRLYGLHGVHPELPLPHRDAVHVQHLRRHLHGHHLLRDHQPDLRQGKGEEDQYPRVCADRALHLKVHIPLI